MTRLIPMTDLVADDLLLDRLGAREHAGTEPVAGLLAALADQADTPLPSRAVRRRIGHKHRFVGPFAALVVAASGAGVAAAVTLPHHAPDPVQKAHVARQTEAAARKDTPGAPLSGLGLPRTSGATDAPGLVMARRGDGLIALVPAAAVVPAGAPGAGAARGAGAAQGDGPDRGGSGQPAGDPRPSGGRDGSPATGHSQGGNGDGQGGNDQGSGTSGAPAGSHTAAPQPRSTGQKQVTGNQGGPGSGDQGGATTTGSVGGSSGSSGSGSDGGQRPVTGSTVTTSPRAATSPSSLMLLPVLGPDTMVVSTTSPSTPPSR